MIPCMLCGNTALFIASVLSLEVRGALSSHSPSVLQAGQAENVDTLSSIADGSWSRVQG